MQTLIKLYYSLEIFLLVKCKLNAYLLHAMAGFIVGAAVVSVTRDPQSAVLAGCVVGMLKEEFDRYSKRGGVDIRSALATALGSAVAALPIITYHLIHRN